jgi:glycine hydroxymethyltransferase
MERTSPAGTTALSLHHAPTVGSRPWTSPRAQDFATAALESLATLDTPELDAEIHGLVRSQERRSDDESLNLYAGTNAMNPRVATLLASTIGSRPNLGSPGDTYNPGMDDGSRLSVLADLVIGRLFGAAYTETRVASGSVANLYVYLATCRPGDPILVLPDEGAGHVTHHRAGAAGLAGLDVHSIAWDAATMGIDHDVFAAQVERIRPRLIIVGASMCLHPFDLSRVRAIADTVGATVLYDAAHMGGLIAGGRFQDPLAEGADVVTGSTYKSFGGPAAGMILTNDADLAERLDRIAYPGLTANFDLARTAALALAALDLHEHGAAYANEQIALSQALAEHLDGGGLPVVRATGRQHPFTQSHHIALRAAPLGGANESVARLERARILSSGIGLPVFQSDDTSLDVGQRGVRLGTQEIVRRGFETTDSGVISALIVRALMGSDADRSAVAEDVLALRVSRAATSATLRYVR